MEKRKNFEYLFEEENEADKKEKEVGWKDEKNKNRKDYTTIFAEISDYWRRKSDPD